MHIKGIAFAIQKFHARIKNAQSFHRARHFFRKDHFIGYRFVLLPEFYGWRISFTPKQNRYSFRVAVFATV